MILFNKIKKQIKKIVKKIFRFLGFNITRIKTNVKIKDYSNLCDYFKCWPNGELFMQYIYSIIIKKGDYVIDVGANHGIHTLQLSELVGEEGKVIACDAISTNIIDIKSKLLMDNVLFHCAALTKPEIANEMKEIEFHYYPDNDGYSGIKGKMNEKIKSREHIITVPTITLDKIIDCMHLKNVVRISFIKIDVEGGDFDVLLGSEAILKEHKPVVVFEYIGEYAKIQYNYTKNDFFGYFNNLGYVLFKFTGNYFLESDWDEKLYHELWLVHKESEWIKFFENSYSNFAYMCMIQRKNVYKAKGIII